MSICQIIDDYRADAGIVTSMKTIDTDAIAYRIRDGIYTRVREYVDKFDLLVEVKSRDGTVFMRSEMKGFHLEIAVKNTLSLEQKEQLIRAQQYGLSKGVRVVVAQVAWYGI